MSAITIKVTNAVTIFAPRRRVSDRLGFTLTGRALTVTIPALLVEAKVGGHAKLSIEDAKNNHTWVEPNLAQHTYGKLNYTHGSHAHRKGETVVLAMVSDGLGKGQGTTSRNFRITCSLAAAEALAFAASLTDTLTVWVDGHNIEITAEVK
jgi:hypothetical protein